jgi:hypothetical protein
MDQHLAELTELTRRIESAETRLRQMTKNDPHVRKLLAIKGIGEVTAWLVAARRGRTL